MNAQPQAQSSTRSQRRAIGIVRVSHTAGREGERFVSPDEQRERIEAACARDGLELIAVYEELDISGGKSLADRPGLSQAVAAIESGKAEVVAAAYFDRLFRSLGTQAEVVGRVEQAGGQVLAVDVGQVTNASAGQWLSGTMMGAVSEYFRRSAKERSAEGQSRAIARGASPHAQMSLGYQRQEDGTLCPDPKTVPVVQAAFRMRAEGKPIQEIRDMVLASGVQRSYRGVQSMLRNRLYLGELHFGKLINLHATEPIINRELFGQVQRMKISRGRRAKSDRLLARLGVLRCGSCGARMTVGSSGGGRPTPPFPIYRCASQNDCSRHVTIDAVIAEEVVSAAVRHALRDAQGRASIAESAQEATRAVSTAQGSLDAALRVFSLTDAENEAAAVERLAELRQARDDAQAQLDRIGPEASRVVSASGDWEDLDLTEHRALIRATVASAVVAAGGRGAERITVQLFGQ